MVGYILIFVWQLSIGGYSVTSQSVRFGSLEACQAAAAAIRKEARKDDGNVAMMVCAREE